MVNKLAGDPKYLVVFTTTQTLLQITKYKSPINFYKPAFLTAGLSIDPQSLLNQKRKNPGTSPNAPYGPWRQHLAHGVHHDQLTEGRAILVQLGSEDKGYPLVISYSLQTGKWSTEIGDLPMNFPNVVNH